MMRLIPPVAVPNVTARVAAAWISGAEDEFGARISRETGFNTVEFFPSGRAALSTLLESWKSPQRDEVVVPAYTCWSVAASIVRAGLKICAVDVDPHTLDYRHDGLESACGPRTAAVLAVHLFARTAATDRVAAAATACGARWIDDAAQALPRGPSGAAAAILSFGRGKPLALGGGGALLSMDGTEVTKRRALRPGGVISALRLGLTCFLGRPAWYRLPRALPFLAVGTTIYDPEFEMDAPFYRWQARLGADLQPRFEANQTRRTEHARGLMAAVDRCHEWIVPAREAIVNAPLRLPVLAPTRAIRDRTRTNLLALGVDASVMYPGTLAQIEGIAPHLVSAPEPSGAAGLVDRLLTLPTYPTLSASDLQRVERAFVAAAAGAA